MRITFTDKTFGRTTNEASALSVTAKFWDDSTETWTAQAPTTVHYRLDTLNGSPVTDWTSVTPGTSVTISLSGSQNAIVYDCSQYEPKQLTVMANRGLSSQYQQTFEYRVMNLEGQV